MARGHQKELAQQRNAKKNSGKKDGSSQKKAASAALVHQCTVCKSQMGDLKTYKQHFESKHSKLPLPDVLKEAA
ncbi:hypothetical protein ACHWQZ_G016722 [Mnemiopsis leidyi]